MYCDFFGLRANPFEDRADARLYCPTPDHEEAVAAMEYAAHYGKGLSLLLGAAGTGKTMLVRVLSQRLHATDHVVVLTVPTGQTVNVLRDVAKGFGVTLPSHPSSRRCLARLRRLLIQKLEAGHRAILILDQAENLTEEDLRKVAALTELERNDRKLLEIIFVGQSQFKELLGSAEFSRMRQQAFEERTLRPLTSDETAAYVSHRLTQCGAGADTFFTDEAIQAVFDASEGNCRLISKICNAAMVAAYGAHCERIDDSIIAEVVQSQRASAKPRGDRDADTDWPPGRDDTPPTSPLQPGPGKTLQVASVSVSSVGRPTRFDEDDHRASPAEEPAEVAVGIARERGTSVRNRRVRKAGTNGSSTAGTASDAELLERLLRRVERSHAMQAASLAQVSTIEVQLEELASTENQISTNIDDTLGRANDRFEEVERRGLAVLDATEARVAALEERARKAEQIATDAERRVIEINEATQRGIEVEQRLNAFSRELGDRVEQAQERVGLLMTGLDAGYEAHDRLESMASQVRELAAQVDKRATVERSGLEEAIASAQRCRAELSEEAVAAHRAEMLKAIRDANQAELEPAKAELARYHDQLSDLVNRSRTELDAVGTSIKARHNEVKATVSTCTEALAELESASKEKAASLNQLCDDQLRDLDNRNRTKLDAVGTSIKARHKEVEAAVSTCAEALVELESASKEKAASLNQLCDDQLRDLDNRNRTKLDAVGTSIKARQEEVEAVVSTCTEAMGELQSTSQEKAAALNQLYDDQLRDLVNRSRTKLDTVGTSIKARHKEVEATVSTCTEAMAELESASKEKAAALNQLYDDQLRDLVNRSRTKLDAVGTSIKARRKEVEAAVSTCTEAMAELESTSREKTASLNQLCNGIEARSEMVAKTVGGLGEEVQRLGAQASEVSGTLRGEREAVDQRIEECRRTAAEVERATAEADQTKSVLTTTLEEKIAQVGSHHAAATSLVRQLAEGTKAGHECQANLGPLRKAATEVIEQLDRARTTAQAEAGPLVEALRDAMQRGRSQLDETKIVQGRIEAVQRTVEGSLMHVGSACERAAELEAKVDGCEKSLQLIGEKEGAIAELVESVNQARAAIESATGEARSFQDQLSAAVEQSSSVLEEVRETHAQLGSRHSGAKSVLQKLTEADERSRETLGRVEEACDRARATVESAEHIEARSIEAREAEGRLAATIDQGTALLQDTKVAQERMEAVHRTVAAGLVDTGAAFERITAVREQTKDCQRLVETLEEARERGDSLAATLSHTVADGHMVHEALAQILRDSNDQTEALGASTSRAAELVDRLGGAEQSAVAIAKKIEQSSVMAGERASAVDRLNRQSRETIEQADARIKTLSSLRDQVASVIESANQKARETQAASERLERLTEDVWSLSGTSEARAKELIARQGEAAALLKQITTATGSMEKIATPLGEMVRLAEERHGGLEKGCHEAAELVNRLKTVPALMEAAKQSQTQLADTAERSDEVRKGLIELNEQADRHVAAMHGLRDATDVAERLTVQRTEAASVLGRLEKASASCKGLAGRIVEQVDRMVDRADRVTERIEGEEIRLETGAKSIASLAKQVQAVASGIKDLKEHSTRIDESITRGMAKPKEIIAAARAQAAQLETVCAAVRKVFAGLSKTTIDSKKQKDAFEAVSHEAGTRLGQLKTETDRATRTLHQWVQEATRAQARLAETLEHVPSIAQTHRPDALARLSSIAAAGPIKTMPAEEGMRVAAQPRTIETSPAPINDATGPADEVARMIEEAKRAPVVQQR